MAGLNREIDSVYENDSFQNEIPKNSYFNYNACLV